jgi:hypothetical protein
VAGTASFVTSLIDWFNKEEHTIFKFIIFATSFLGSLAGLIHMIIKEVVYSNHGDGFSIMPGAYFFVPCLLSYAVGFFTYVRR